MDLNKDGSYSATFRGFPASPAWLQIDLVEKTGKDQDYVARFSSQIIIELRAADGALVCKASGRLNQFHGVGNHHWVLTSSVDSAGFWNSDCLNLKMHKRASYTLEIIVEEATKAFGPLRARPLLLGGGHEPCC